MTDWRALCGSLVASTFLLLSRTFARLICNCPVGGEILDSASFATCQFLLANGVLGILHGKIIIFRVFFLWVDYGIGAFDRDSVILISIVEIS